MQSDLDYIALEQHALDALRAKLGVKARDLPRAMKNVGRRLPREAHRAALVLSDAKGHAAHPKLARMIDVHSVEVAARVLHEHLEKIDPKARRKNMILDMLGVQAINILVVIALVIGLMMWRGLL
jgi:hypothetical protein